MRCFRRAIFAFWLLPACLQAEAADDFSWASLVDSDTEIRYAAARHLAEHPEKILISPETIEELVAAVRAERTPHVRHQLALSLGRLRSDHDAIVEAEIEAVKKESDPATRAIWIISLAPVEKTNRRASEIVKHALLRDGEVLVRQAALRVMTRIASKDPERRWTIAQAALDPEPTVAGPALEDLAHFPSPDPRVLNLLESHFPEVAGASRENPVVAYTLSTVAMIRARCLAGDTKSDWENLRREIDALDEGELAHAHWALVRKLATLDPNSPADRACLDQISVLLSDTVITDQELLSELGDQLTDLTVATPVKIKIAAIAPSFLFYDRESETHFARATADCLFYPDPRFRSVAAGALRSLHTDDSTGAEIGRTLAFLAGKETDPRLRHELELTLSHWSDPQYRGRIVHQILHAPDLALRKKYIAGLTESVYPDKVIYLDPKTARALAHVLAQDASPEIRQRSSQALSYLNPDILRATPRIFVPALLNGLRDETEAKTRESSAASLGRTRSEDREVARVLVAAFEKDPVAKVRSAAGQALTDLRAPKPEIRDAFVRALETPSPPGDGAGIATRAMAVRGLTALWSDDPATRDIVGRALENEPEAKVRVSALEGILDAGDRSPDVIARVVRAMEKDAHPSARTRAAHILAKWAPTSPDVIPNLIEAHKKENAYAAQEEQRAALKSIGLRDPRVHRFMIQLLNENPGEYIRADAAEFLGQAESTDPDAQKSLSWACERDPSSLVKLRAQSALARLQR